MSTATLDQFMAFNDQLAALVRAGVPIDVGLGSAEPDTLSALERINATVARRVRLGATLSQALESDEHTVPTFYRSLLQVALQSGNLTAALSGYTRVCVSADNSWYAVKLGLLYPMLLCCLAYAGLVGLCFYFVPTLENLYQTLHFRPQAGLQVLQTLRGTLPYWVGIGPLALLFLGGWWLVTRRNRKSKAPSSRSLNWLPGMPQAIHFQRCATFAEILAALLVNNMSLEEGLELAAGSSGDAGLRAGARELAESLRSGQLPADSSLAARRFPPFLRWALWHSEATTGRARALSMAANLYRDAAQHTFGRLQIAVPLVACVVIGGSVTLLYGLALFVPVVELLRQLSQ